MIRYINSEGKEYKFYDARVRATSGNFHKHAWTPETSKRKIGEIVQGFEKDAAEYEITFTVRGALEDRKTFLDEMQDAFETDVLLERPGRIYFGDYYIDGFVTSSETKTSDIAVYYSQNKVKLYCPRPIWTKENPYTFYSYGASSSDNKRYPGRYPFRYANGMNNTHVQNPHFTDANFTLVIYGPVVNPQVIIGDKSYLVNIVLEQGDRLVTCATIAQSFMLVVTMPLGGISAGTGTILAYNYGARRRDRILKAQAFIAGLCVAYVTALFLLARLGGALFVRLFTTEPELAAEALSAIHICTLALIPLGLQYAIVDGFTGMGKVQLALPLSAFRKAVYFIALFALPAVFGARAAFYAEPISDIAGPVVSIAVYALCIRRILDFPADPPAAENKSTLPS